MDLEDELVTVKNKSNAPIALGTWYISSNIGAQKFTFPKNTNIAAGATIRVYSGPQAATKSSAAGSLMWTKRNVWNNKGDSATLFDVSSIRNRRAGIVL